jgi:predicted DNA-binding transcriptional regulator AlpA
MMATKEQFAFSLRQKVELLTADELAVMMDVSEHTVESWRKEGTGPAYTRLGRRIYYPLQGIKDWIEANKNRPKFDDKENQDDRNPAPDSRNGQ